MSEGLIFTDLFKKLVILGICLGKLRERKKKKKTIVPINIVYHI